MKKLKISIIDLIHNSPSFSLYRLAMFPNYISIMPQIIGVWCREEGHEVNYSIFTGLQNLNDLTKDQTDLVFISSFTFTAQLAYALSNYYRSKGIVTVLGGPHARCYPEDASLYFDFVLGLTNKELLNDLLHNFGINKQRGIYLTALNQPLSIPGVRERWEFIEKVQKLTSIVDIVPMIGSFGCPYQCDFCIDADIPYQMLDTEIIKSDLRFLLKKMKRPWVSWYDPNFGINFNQTMEIIESAVHQGSFEFTAECSLSVLSEANVKRLKKNGFMMIMPGIESWFDYGKKSRVGSITGIDKVREVSEQVNMIQRHIPQVQTNFMFGHDSDSGEEPFELTKRFVDLSPGAYPSFALLSVFGRGVKGNIKYEIEDRIIPFPFHLMRSVHTLNIIPKNYSWEFLYLNFIDLLDYCFSNKAMYRRFKANHLTGPRWVTLLLSLTIGGNGKKRYLNALLNRLRNDPDFQSFVTKQNDRVPDFMIEKVKNDLGPLWEWLPNKTLSYDFNILSKSVAMMH